MEFYIYKWLHKGNWGLLDISLVLKFELYMFCLITFLYFYILWNAWWTKCELCCCWWKSLIPYLSQLSVFHGHGHCVNARCRCVHTATISYLHSVPHLESHLAFRLCCSVLWAALILPLVLLTVTLSIYPCLTISFRECQILNCRARV